MSALSLQTLFDLDTVIDCVAIFYVFVCESYELGIDETCIVSGDEVGFLFFASGSEAEDQLSYFGFGLRI